MIIEHIHIKPEVAQKIEKKHNVTEEEVREVLFFSDEEPRIRRSKKKGRYVAFGRTVAGRYLAIIFVPERALGASLISAREMDSREKRRFRQRR